MKVSLACLTRLTLGRRAACAAKGFSKICFNIALQHRNYMAQSDPPNRGFLEVWKWSDVDGRAPDLHGNAAQRRVEQNIGDRRAILFQAISYGRCPKTNYDIWVHSESESRVTYNGEAKAGTNAYWRLPFFPSRADL